MDAFTSLFLPLRPVCCFSYLNSMHRSLETWKADLVRRRPDLRRPSIGPKNKLVSHPVMFFQLGSRNTGTVRSISIRTGRVARQLSVPEHCAVDKPGLIFHAGAPKLLQAEDLGNPS